HLRMVCASSEKAVHEHRTVALTTKIDGCGSLIVFTFKNPGRAVRYLPASHRSVRAEFLQTVPLVMGSLKFGCAQFVAFLKAPDSAATWYISPTTTPVCLPI